MPIIISIAVMFQLAMVIVYERRAGLHSKLRRFLAKMCKVVFLINAVWIIALTAEQYGAIEIDDTLKAVLTVAFMLFTIDILATVMYMKYLDIISDPLTRLLNRRFLETKFNKAVCSGKEGDVYLMHLDLDFLKRVNDNFGHSMGAKYIVRLGEIIQKVIKATGAHGARMGGDEMAIVFPKGGMKSISKAEEIIRKGQEEANKDPQIPMPFSVSYGYVKWTRNMTFKDIRMLADKQVEIMKAENHKKLKM